MVARFVPICALKLLGGTDMKRLIALAGAMSVAACQQPIVSTADNATELRAAQSRIEQLENEIAALKERKPIAENDREAAKAEPQKRVSALHGDDLVANASPERSLCWQDYCPCEPGQDGEGMEESLCRNLKAGIHVDGDVMAAAAMARDARRQIREFNQQNPGY